MNRRDTLLVLLAIGATPLVSFAQQPGKVWRVGYLDVGSRQSQVDVGRYDVLLSGLREVGYVEGKNLVLETRFADGNAERLDGLAAELVRLKMDVILTFGTAATHAAQRTTATVPIVVIATGDPVRDGFAESLSRPGGNITGLSVGINEIVQKYVELLIAMVPKLSRVAVIVNANNAGHAPLLLSVQLAVQRRGLSMLPISVRGAGDIESGFATIARENAGAVIILPDAFLFQQRLQISKLALNYRLPTMAMTAEYVEIGILMSYGLNINDNVRRAMNFVDRIFKGAKPGELAFESPTRYYLTINRPTATALGLQIPQQLMLSADRVIK